MADVTWYSQNFEGATGDFAGQDQWYAIPTNNAEPLPSEEAFYVSGTHVVSGVQSLQCNVVAANRKNAVGTSVNNVTRMLGRRMFDIPDHTKYTVQFDIRAYTQGTYGNSNTLNVMGCSATDTNISWMLQFYRGTVSGTHYLRTTFYKPVEAAAFAPPPPTGKGGPMVASPFNASTTLLDITSAPKTIRAVHYADRTFEVYVPNLSADPLFSGLSYGPDDMDRLKLVSMGIRQTFSPNPDIFEYAIDNLLVTYTPVATPSEVISLAPKMSDAILLGGH